MSGAQRGVSFNQDGEQSLGSPVKFRLDPPGITSLPPQTSLGSLSGGPKLETAGAESVPYMDLIKSVVVSGAFESSTTSQGVILSVWTPTPGELPEPV